MPTLPSDALQHPSPVHGSTLPRWLAKLAPERFFARSAAAPPTKSGRPCPQLQSSALKICSKHIGRRRHLTGSLLFLDAGDGCLPHQDTVRRWLSLRRAGLCILDSDVVVVLQGIDSQSYYCVLAWKLEAGPGSVLQLLALVRIQVVGLIPCRARAAPGSPSSRTRPGRPGHPGNGREPPQQCPATDRRQSCPSLPSFLAPRAPS